MVGQRKMERQKLTFALKRMQNWGMMEMEYCKDVRSFTKLVPALEKYPNKSIVTVDDDIYYSSNLIQFMHQESQHSHNNIIAYRQATYSYEAEQKFTLPLGTGGILYPPQSLHENVFDTQLSIELCSSLDDLWFYVMSLLKKQTFHFYQSLSLHTIIPIYSTRNSIKAVDYMTSYLLTIKKF